MRRYLLLKWIADLLDTPQEDVPQEDPPVDDPVDEVPTVLIPWEEVLTLAEENNYTYMPVSIVKADADLSLFRFNGDSLTDDYDINVLFNGTEFDLGEIFGVNLQNAFQDQTTNGVGDYWWETTSGQTLMTNFPRFTLRFPSGTPSWGNSTDPAFPGRGWQKFVTNQAMGPGNSLNPGEDFDEDYTNLAASDGTESTNWFTLYTGGVLSIGSASNNNGDHVGCINYHMDWNGTSYDTTELTTFINDGEFGYIELGNEMNAAGAKGVFPNPTDFTDGGYGWDGVTPSPGPRGNYVLQNRNFAKTRAAQIRAIDPTIEICVTAPPPTWYHFEQNGVTLTGSELYNKNFMLNVINTKKDNTFDYDTLVHHTYNQVSDVIPRTLSLVTSQITDYVPKRDVSCKGGTCYNLFFHGIQSDYLKYLWEVYIKPHDLLYQQNGLPLPNHCITEWAMSNSAEGLIDTMLSGHNVMRYLMAFAKIRELTNGRFSMATFQKWHAHTVSPVVGDRPYALGIIIEAQVGNIYGATVGTDFQATVEYEAFALWTPVVGGKILGTEKFAKNNLPGNLTDELVHIEIMEDTGGDKYLFYSNASDNDYTINREGTNTYIQGSSTGIGSTADENIWASGTYDGGVANYPLISKTTVGSDRTLRAKTFGRIDL